LSDQHEQGHDEQQHEEPRGVELAKTIDQADPGYPNSDQSSGFRSVYSPRT
jgi:hypothetical protein